MRPERRGLAVASIVLSLVGVVAVVALHFLRPELAPVSHRLSEYAIGRYGGLMTAAFVLVGASLLTLAGAIVGDDRRLWSRVVAAAVGIAGVGMIVSGAYRTDVSRSGATADAVHSAASGLATLALIGAAVVWTAVASRRTAPIVLAAMSLALGAVSPALHRSRWTGLSQRLLWLTLLAWVVVAAFELTRRVPPSRAASRV
jgi:uncharacterized membrane protein YuzA (DUF378 family)